MRPAATAWSGEHQAVFNRFLASPAGQALWERLRAVEADIAARAVQDVMHTAHSAGHAAGFADCRKWMESISRVDPGATQTGSDDGHGVSEGELLMSEYTSP